MKRPVENFNDHTRNDKKNIVEFCKYYHDGIYDLDAWEFIHELECIDSDGQEYYTWFGFRLKPHRYSDYDGRYYSLVYMMPNDYKMRDSLEYVDCRKNILVQNFVKIMFDKEIHKHAQLLNTRLINAYIKKPHSTGGTLANE